MSAAPAAFFWGDDAKLDSGAPGEFDSASRLTRAVILRGKVDKPGDREYAQFAWGLPGAHKVC